MDAYSFPRVSRCSLPRGSLAEAGSPVPGNCSQRGRTQTQVKTHSWHGNGEGDIGAACWTAYGSGRRPQSVSGRVPLSHPRRRLRDQHAVVHGYSTPCVCAQYGAYAVRAGIEPANAALALPSRHFPAGGSCSPLVHVDYLLVSVQQCRQPIGFLYACVKLSILPRKIISLPLDRRDAHCTNELHLGTRGAALRC